jgi:hypothetical protein
MEGDACASSEGEDATHLLTESDTFRGSKELKSQAKDLVTVLLRNRTCTGEWSKPSFEAASKDTPLVGAGAFLSELVKPGHEEGFYFKKAKGKLQGCFRLHMNSPAASLSVSLGPEDQCVAVKLLEEPSERAVLSTELDGNSQGRTSKSSGSVRKRVFCVQVGLADGTAMEMSEETVILEITELGVPPTLLGYGMQTLFRDTTVGEMLPLMGKLPADPAVQCWQLEGQLPAGLKMASETGIISGVPREAGRFNVNITAVHPAGSSTARVQLSIELDPEAKEAVLHGAITSIEFHAHRELRLPATNAAIDVSFNSAFKDAVEKMRLALGGAGGASTDTYVRRLLDAMAVSATSARQLSRAIASRAQREVIVPFDFRDIQDALDSLGGEGGTVTVLDGTYFGNLRIEKHVVLQGKEGTRQPVLDGHIKVVAGGEYSVFKHLVLRVSMGTVTEPVISITCGHPIVERCDISSHGPNLVHVQRRDGPGTSLALWGNVIHYPPLKSHQSSSILVDDGCRVDAKRNVFFDATQGVKLLGKASMISRGNAVMPVDPFEKRDMANDAHERQKWPKPESRVEPFAAPKQVSVHSFNWSEKGVGRRPDTAPRSWVPLKNRPRQEDLNESIYKTSPTASWKQANRWADEELRAQGDVGLWAANHCVRRLLTGPSWRDQKPAGKRKLKSILKVPHNFAELSSLSISSSCPAIRPSTR